MEKSVLRRQVDHTGMTMELEQYSKAEDKKSELLLFIKSLSYYYRLSLRFFVLDDSIEVRKVSTKLAQTRTIGAVFELEELLRQASLPIEQRDPHHQLVLSTWAWLDQNRVDSAGFSTLTTTLSV